MTKLKKFLLFFFSISGGFLISLILTLAVWNLQIEHRAFQCTDDCGFGGFFEDMQAHHNAGDKVLPGWSWQDIYDAKLAYTVAFYLIWVAISCAPILLTFSKAKRQSRIRTLTPA
jgi:hypothetical protein